MKQLKLVAISSLILVAFLATLASAEHAPAVPGHSRGLFVVEDALAQFQAIKHHGEALGWILPEAAGAPDPSLFDHYQGLARYPGQGTPLFYVTQKDDDDATAPGAEGPGGYLHVVRFGSRATDGERLRSNLQAFGSDTKHTYPSSEDIWQRSIRFDGRLRIDGTEILPAYVHPGGVAIVDDILFMALDSPHSSSAPEGQIVLFELRGDPEVPLATHAFPLDHGIDNLGVTEQADGTFLIWVNGGSGGITRFYQTSSTNLRDDLITLELVQVWDGGSSADYDGAGHDWPTGAGAHQSSTFLREPDGSLYMIGMRHTLGGDIGSDYADLYRVDGKPGGGFKLTRLSTRNFHCEFRMSGGEWETDGRICNFAAADGTYVSPTGELILYSMPHDDEDSNDPDYVRLGEFRHRDVSRENSPLRAPVANANGPYSAVEGGTVTLSGSGWALADRPWVELYDDDHWDDRSIVVDYDDRFLLELNNFNNLDGFGDKTTSIRWRMPVGLDAELFDDHNFSDRSIILRGTGQTEAVADLEDQVVVPGVIEHPGRSAGTSVGFNDKTSSMRFVGAPANTGLSLSWDLDGDGIFGETGAAALRGDEAGATVTFSAAGLDGPAEVPVVLRVSEGGVSSDSQATIGLSNVAPSAGFANSSGTIIEGETALLTFTNQQDPSPADVAAGFTYAYDCTDDGTLEAVGSSQPEFACMYGQAGTYQARGIIRDKDGGTAAYIVEVRVLSPAEAIAGLVELVEELNLQRGIDNSLDAKLQAALGALDELNGGDVSAAINILQAFINNVEAQRGKQITSEQADILIDMTQRIIDSLSAG